MVLGGGRNKFKTSSMKESQSRAAARAASASASQITSQNTSERSHKEKQPSVQITSPDDSDIELFPSQDSSKNVSTSPVPLKQFERMLQKALKQTAEHITSSLTREIRELGTRTDVLENKFEVMELSVQDTMKEIENLKEENFTLQSRLEDYENRARRSNIRIRGIPETVTDLPSTITALFQELQPTIPIERLEMDRVHRALAPKKIDGPPRDIIAKLHYYRTKEQLISAAREKHNLSFQGHDYQLFTDLSQLTINKRRAMKPQLAVLQNHHIIYQWGFPFSIRFTHQGSRFTCRSPEELQLTLQDLHLVDKSQSTNLTRRRSTSNNPGNHQANKRSRIASPPLEQEDSMD